MSESLIPADVRSRLQDLRLNARRAIGARGIGLHRSRSRGAGLEFAQYRAYEPGDEPRQIDWKLYARSDRFFVREAERESPLTAWLLVDASAFVFAYFAVGRSKQLQKLAARWSSVLLVALGYAAGAPWIGWLAALLAALTAYVRTLGGALGFAQDFGGPMAKQHRMALMTLACVAAPIEAMLAQSRYALLCCAWAIALGAALTCWFRLRRISRQLRGLA